MEDFVTPAPDYKLEQSSTEVVLTVHAPLCRSSDISVFLEKRTITFEAHPYFLKVKLPCKVSNDNNEETFDEKTGTYTLTLKREVDNGEESASDGKEYTLIESISHSTAQEQIDSEKPSYGFANVFSGKFGQFYSEFSQVINVEDPDNMGVKDRTYLKEKEEREKWSEDHYLADLMDNEHILPLFKYVPPWSLTGMKDLTDEEKDILQCVPKHECLESSLSDDRVRLAELQMVDILLSYCYNKRTTEGENTVESAWTINKLSSCLSWLEVFHDLKSVILSFYRRSLTYPFYRNWQLTKIIHQDVTDLLKLGSSTATRCFIEMKELFHESENRYILNNLYIDLLCHFCYSLSKERLTELAEEIEKIEIEKPEVHEDLIILEIGAKMALEEENRSTETQKIMKGLTEKVSTLNLDDSGTTSSEDGFYSDSTESSSSSSE